MSAVDYLISYAQNAEDIFLSSFFPDVTHGFYVDIGANHPVIHSTTKRFSLDGWRGVNIEPIARHFHALHLDRPNDINLRIGISDEPGQLTFREYVGDGLSTFSDGMQALYDQELNSAATAEYREYEVEVRTLRDVLTEHPLPTIHFMKVDVEGYEYEALESNDWERFRPEVLCIEANHVLRDWHPLLAEARYRSAFFDGLNEYYVAEEAGRRMAMFRDEYVKFLNGPPVLPYPLSLELARRDREGQALHEELARAQARIHQLTTQLARARRGAPAATAPARFRDIVRDVDTATQQGLSRWRRESAEARRRRLESSAFSGGNAHALLAAIQETDTTVFTGGIGPSSASQVSERAYSESRRVARTSLRRLKGIRRRLRRLQKRGRR